MYFTDRGKSEIYFVCVVDSFYDFWKCENSQVFDERSVKLCTLGLMLSHFTNTIIGLDVPDLGGQMKGQFH